jgi:hypothetical protein
LSIGSPSKEGWSSLMRHNIDWIDMFRSRDMILFPEQISVNPHMHCFGGGLSHQTFQASWDLSSTHQYSS